MNPTDPPRYEPYQTQPAAAGLTCPKCAGQMRTYERNGIHLEQCTSCRGVFLDFGELEALTQLEGQFTRMPPAAQPGYGPAWGNRDGHRYRRGGLSGLFFSS